MLERDVEDEEGTLSDEDEESRILLLASQGMGDEGRFDRLMGEDCRPPSTGVVESHLTFLSTSLTRFSRASNLVL